jgi:hypothetical protein
VIVALIILWFIVALVVVTYGASNGAVTELGWPRWTTPAIMGTGCLMIAVMFVAMGVSVVTNVPGDWHLRSVHTHGEGGGGGGD